MGQESYVALDDVAVTKETEKAILVKLDTDEEIWVPKSQIAGESEVQGEGDEGTLTITEWFAKREGIDF